MVWTVADAAASRRRYGGYSDQQADVYGIPRNILRTLIDQESKWNPRAQSPTGPQGMGQLSQAAALDCGMNPGDRFNPRKNIDCTAKYLSARIEQAKGDIRRGLELYHGGPSGGATAEMRAVDSRYARDILIDSGHVKGKDAAAIAKPIMVECPEFSLISPGKWMAAMKCAFKGALLVMSIVGLVGYAGFAALRAGG